MSLLCVLGSWRCSLFKYVIELDDDQMTASVTRIRLSDPLEQHHIPGIIWIAPSGDVRWGKRFRLKSTQSILGKSLTWEARNGSSWTWPVYTQKTWKTAPPRLSLDDEMALQVMTSNAVHRWLLAL